MAKHPKPGSWRDNDGFYIAAKEQGLEVNEISCTADAPYGSAAFARKMIAPVPFHLKGGSVTLTSILHDGSPCLHCGTIT